MNTKNEQPMKQIIENGTLIYCYESEYVKGNTIAVYNPRGCDVVVTPGDNVLAVHHPQISPSGDIMECGVVALDYNFVAKGFMNPENIDQPIYYVSKEITNHFGLDWDGDHLHICKGDKDE